MAITGVTSLRFCFAFFGLGERYRDVSPIIPSRTIVSIFGVLESTTKLRPRIDEVVWRSPAPLQPARSSLSLLTPANLRQAI
jgi:hypothetical protein